MVTRESKESMAAVIIRPQEPADAAALHAIAINPKVARHILQLPSMERSQSEAWAQEVNPNNHRYVAVMDGQVVGSAGLTQPTNPRLSHTGRLGIAVRPDFWGQGIGTQLMQKLVGLADNWLRVGRMELEVYTDNPAAIQLYRKFEFEVEGTKRQQAYGDGRWADTHVMARIRPDWPRFPVGKAGFLPPRPPRDPEMSGLQIRPLLAADLTDLMSFWGHPQVARGTLQMPSLNEAFVRQRVEAWGEGRNRFVAVLAGRVIGDIFLGQYQNPRLLHSAGIGMRVHPEYWGQGVGSRLMAAVLDLADHWLNLRRVELEVNTDNPAAIKLYEKFNFEIEGTKRWHVYGDGRWADSHFMARLRET